MKTGVGIVATKWVIERPMIFKASVAQAHGRIGTFSPGFGCTIADAVQASCSAYPFFNRKMVRTESRRRRRVDRWRILRQQPHALCLGRRNHCYENSAWEHPRSEFQVLASILKPKPGLMCLAKKYLVSVQLLQKTLEINTQSMDQLRAIMFKDIPTIRISDTFQTPEMATDLFEHDLAKLNILRQRGRELFANP